MSPFVILPKKIFTGITSYIGNLTVESCFFKKIGSVSAGGPIVFVGYDQGVTDFPNLPVDNIIVRGNVFENCTTGSAAMKVFFDGSEIDSITSASTVSMSKNFISLSNNHYNL
jgi:hypothetical protein